MEENIVLSEEEVIFEDTVEPKPDRFDLNNKDSVFKIIFSIGAVLLTLFGIWGGFRGGFTVTSLLLFISVTAYLISKQSKIKVFPLLCGILSCLLSVGFIVTSNGGVRFFSAVCMSLLSAVWYVSLVKTNEKEGDFAFLHNITSPFILGSTVNLPKSVVAFFTFGKKGNKKFGKIMLGIALSVPVLVIVVPLLMQSDAAFSGLVDKLFGNLAFNLFKVGLGLVIAVFLISYSFTLKKQEIPAAVRHNMLVLDNTVTISFLSVLGVCYLTYLFSQLAYFFSAFKGILPDDYTFTLSGYARRGFFEMCIIAVINFIIIYFVLIFSQKKERKINIISRIFCTFIGIFTLVIIATALSKMFLYISKYGMTELRITTSAFMVFLAIVFISVMLRIFIPEIKVLKVGFITAACVLCVLSIANVNRIIADYNYSAYKNKILEDIDVNAIYDLGDEGVPYLVRLTEDKDYDVCETAKNYVENLICHGHYYTFENQSDMYLFSERGYQITGRKYNGIGQYSISRAKAYAALDEYIKNNPEVLY